MNSRKVKFCRECGTPNHGLRPSTVLPILEDENVQLRRLERPAAVTARTPEALTNEGIERDAQPEGGINEALGDAFTTYGQRSHNGM